MRLRSLLLSLAATSVAAMLFGAAVPALAGDAKPAYEIAMVKMSEEIWGAIRYNARTGECWQAVGGSWVKIRDDDKIPESIYAVRMVPLKNDWGAIRFDQVSGRAWSAIDGGWTEIKEKSEK